MKSRISFSLLCACGALSLAAAEIEKSIRPVAIAGQSARGTVSGVQFNQFGELSLADDGRVAFIANLIGTGVTQTNRQGLWAGLPGDALLVARTGNPAPGAPVGTVISLLAAPNLDNHQAVGFLALFSGPGFGEVSAQADLEGIGVLSALVVDENNLDEGAWKAPTTWSNSEGFGTTFASVLGHVINVAAARATLSGPNIGPTNDTAIMSGSPTNLVIVAQEGSPAPGATGNFVYFPPESDALAVAPDGNVIFLATATDGGARDGIWFGKAGNLQLAALPNRPAPQSLLGSGYTFGTLIGAGVAINGRGEVAFGVRLNGPGLNSTNSECVVAGTPGELRVFARSGQPAPGIAGAFFRRSAGGSAAFSRVVLGANGGVAFVASYSASNSDFGLWLAPTNGATPILLARNGQQAPGAPDGVLFHTRFEYDIPFEQIYMNARGQVAFRVSLTGPGIGLTNQYGIWLADSDGNVSPVVRGGDVIEVAEGHSRELQTILFGTDPLSVAGSEDGRRTPFNDRGELLFTAQWVNPPGPSPIGTSGLFLARAGLVLHGERVGSDIRLRFPTLSGSQYRVDYRTNLHSGNWSVLTNALAGTGNEISVTDAKAASLGERFYRAVRTD